jgi:hypothetical protein
MGEAETRSFFYDSHVVCFYIPFDVFIFFSWYDMGEGKKRVDDECVCVFVHIPNRPRVLVFFWQS